MLPSDPQWWWMPNVVVLQTTPKVERYDTETNAWVDWTGTEQDPTDGNGWDNTFYPGAPGVTQHTGSYASMHGGPTPSAPAHSGTSGHFGGKVQLPQSENGTEFRVKFPFTVHAGADSDNATVTNWKEYLHADCKSEINSSSPSSNSGWGNW
ncbi:MAG: hypothetical protein HMLKMBBP_03769 [Planctomycetes bacterium]|nr:hypothetical protein [Planctomycetota bacterium]